MPKRIITTLALILIFVTKLFSQETVVKGKLLGNDGLPMLKANIEFINSLEKVDTIRVPVDKDGNYQFKCTLPGFTFVTFAGINHSSQGVRIINDKDQTIDLDVRLGGYEYTDTIKNLGIVGDFNNFDLRSPVPMTKQENGTWTYSMNWDKPTFAYQLLGVEKTGHSINGTQSEDFIYDNGGDYRSVISVHNGKVEVVFDPSKLVRIDTKSEVIFKELNAVTAIVYEYQNLYNDYVNEYSKEFTAYKKTSKDPMAFKFSRTDLINAFRDKYLNEINPTAKEIGFSFYFTLPRTEKSDIDSVRIIRLLSSLKPDSYLWSANQNLFMFTNYFFGEKKGDSLANAIFEKNNDTDLKLRILTQKYFYARARGQKEKVEEIYKQVSENYGNTVAGKFFLKQFAPVMNVRTGAEVPDFSLKSIDDSTKVISKSNMLGKIYLIDFWATWCGPCVGELPGLHEAYKKFKDKGFEIVSISLDGKLETVKDFRIKQYKMPWLNAFIGADWNQPIVKSFELVGIPKPLLIGKDGKILALESEIRGENLEKTLAKYFQ